jgi:TetR/AcrR family transcriptional regulator, regulator of autoinduction and epiphytic fitness
MQKPDEEKRKAILRVAQDLFSRRPYHEVRLEDVAAGAKVGKGTLYIYFENKEHLYVDLVVEAYDALLAEIEKHADRNERPCWQVLEDAVRGLAAWAVRHPKIFDLIRDGSNPARAATFRARRRRLGDHLERILRRCIEAGEVVDPSPDLTAQFIAAMARAGVVWGKRSLKADELAERMLAVVGGGIRVKEPMHQRSRKPTADATAGGRR